MTVERKRLIIEMGMGIDQHGQDPSVAAARAVRNATALAAAKRSLTMPYLEFGKWLV
jgi:uncharacterized protein (TIGR02058 family)